MLGALIKTGWWLWVSVRNRLEPPLPGWTKVSRHLTHHQAVLAAARHYLDLRAKGDETIVMAISRGISHRVVQR